MGVLLPPGASQVVIYESHSGDRTPDWLDILKLGLEPLGVPYNITTRGSISRQPGQERIAYLSQVRNAVISPTFKQPCAGRSGEAGMPCFEPTDVLFVNDVYW